MANTYVAIATVTVGSGGASSIDFSSIPGTYTDLVLKLSARTNRASTQDGVYWEYNGSTTSKSGRALYGTGTTAGSDNKSDQYNYGATSTNATANTFGNMEIYIPNYTSSNNKSSSSDGVTEDNSASGNFMGLATALWSNTAAITSVSLKPLFGTSFVQYSTATLYGIKNS